MRDTELSLPFVASALRRAGLDGWIPEGDGKGSLPLQFLPDGAGWVELMRLERACASACTATAARCMR